MDRPRVESFLVVSDLRISFSILMIQSDFIPLLILRLWGIGVICASASQLYWFLRNTGMVPRLVRVLYLSLSFTFFVMEGFLAWLCFDKHQVMIQSTI